MAKQIGIIKLQGTIGDLTFYRGEDGQYGAKAKTSLSKERIENDPAFVRTRENGAEFGRAGTAGKLVRDAFAEMTGGADRRMVSRLHKQMMFCLQADTTSVRGQRNVSQGDPGLINGFDFNLDGKLASTFKAAFSKVVDRTTGILDIVIPAFVPEVAVKAPQGATHFKLVAAAAEVDYDNKVTVSDSIASAFLPIDNVATALLTLSVTLTANTTLPLYQVLGVHFYQEMNGAKYALNNGGYDAVCIVNADV
jgi:hypothetical protein